MAPARRLIRLAISAKRERMVTASDVVRLEVDEAMIKEAIRKGLQKVFEDNLRHRDPRVQLDCKIRGYVGEMAIKRFFDGYGITFAATNEIRDGDHIDIDLRYKDYSLEIKTSLVPDSDAEVSDPPMVRIQKCIQNPHRDIKLIRRCEKIEDLGGDIHVQIYFAHLRQKRDQFLQATPIDLLRLDPKNNGHIERIYAAFKARTYIDRTFFVAWVDKESLKSYIASLPKKLQTWRYEKREFWRCPFRECAKKPRAIVGYLRTLA